ncbi:DUF166 domain-containing protein [Methanobacterium ferruginis]|jgi:hypothetical protein|uniref:DUF166 domain-containing protein n=1 Tax=Methanobacterium ferruginis TaxID=710191 RepID=UPI0025726040|nr:DUF166 family protein [Methanobacterium ferruginis]MCC7551585.1 hypothetical protein [Methanobacterium sp.]BDZ68238.1 hypothetical protein GCM10025860_16860 [Methanobacterium ferruginis]
MLKVAIVTDGPYGDRAFDNIKKEFETVFIELEQPSSMFMDDIELPEKKAELMGEVNILITYTTHPDLTLELVERFADKVDWIIVAAWKGDGFKNQLESHDNVICPYIMCEIEENGDPIFDKFAIDIGKPKVFLKLNGEKLKDIVVLRSSPCGSTTFVVDYIKGKYAGKKLNPEILPTEAGLKLQHYPCRAAKMRIFSDEECKKEMASGFHRDAFQEAMNLTPKN